MEFKLSINDGNKSYKHVIREPETNVFIGRKIGNKIEGKEIGFNGYEFIINGGGDKTGVPMHKGVEGGERNKVLKRQKDGRAVRKSIVGNTISENISQINLTISKKGKKKIEDYFKKEEAPAEEK